MEKTIKIMRIIIYVVLSLACCALAALFGVSQRHVNEQAKRIERQDIIIDSLLARRMHVFDVKMTVTDKSKSIVYGKYNKGNINMPTEKIYILDFDTLKVN